MPKNASILLVEDNPLDEILTLRSLTLGQISNQTQIVRDGQEALDYLFCEGIFSGRPQVNPQVILLDLKLPKVDGIEVLRLIRADKRTQYIPVIILTSSTEELDVAKCVSNGANHYLTKPVVIEDLCDALRSFLFSRAQSIKKTE